MEFFRAVFSRICNKYGDLLRKSSYSVQMRENMDQEKSVFDTFHAAYGFIFHQTQLQITFLKLVTICS